MTLLIPTSNDEIDAGERRGDAGEGLDQEIAAFLVVEAAEKKDERPQAQGGKLLVKSLDLEVRVAFGLDNSVRDDDAVPLARLEAGLGKVALDFSGKEYGVSVAQDGILEVPIEGFLEAFVRVGFIEPGVEAAVHKHGIGFAGGTGGSAHGNIGKGPDAVEDDGVEAGKIFAEPRTQTSGEAEAAKVGRAESMDDKREVGEVRCIGRIEADDFGVFAEAAPAFRHQVDCFGETPVARRESAYGVKDMHDLI